MTSIAVLTLALVAGAQEPAAKGTYSGPKEKLHVYLLVGQSNMSGRARVEGEDHKIPASLFLLDDAGRWASATHPFIQYTNVPSSADTRVIQAKGKTGLNLGLTFARRMLEAQPGVSIGLIVNSQGGSAIESWKKGVKKSNYDPTLRRLLAARDSGVLKGILWHQGEANVGLGERYLDPLAELIAQFRKDLGDPRLPFVAGQIAPQKKRNDRIAPFNEALLKLPGRVPNTAVVRATDLLGDDVHFDSAQTRELGRRYAAEMLKLQAQRGQD